MRFVCTVFPSVFLLAAITLSGGRLCAAHVEATFGIALTNETDWAFGPGVLINKESGYPYIARMDDGFIASPNFGFAVTSVTVEAWNATAIPRERSISRRLRHPAFAAIRLRPADWTYPKILGN